MTPRLNALDAFDTVGKLGPALGISPPPEANLKFDIRDRDPHDWGRDFACDQPKNRRKVDCLQKVIGVWRGTSVLCAVTTVSYPVCFLQQRVLKASKLKILSRHVCLSLFLSFISSSASTKYEESEVKCGARSNARRKNLAVNIMKTRALHCLHVKYRNTF